MPITRPDFHSIDERDLQELVDAGATESQILEFKRDAYGHVDAEKKEFLKDEVTRLSSIATSGIEPPIVGLRMKSVRAGQSNCIVVRVPQSWNAPHRVAFQHWNKFFIRHANSVDEVSMDELRALFGFGTQAIERIRSYHRLRVSQIASGEGPRPLAGQGRLIVHCCPLIAFASTSEIDLDRAMALDRNIRPIGAAGYSPRLNMAAPSGGSPQLLTSTVSRR